MRWKNGGGWTSEIAISPSGSEAARAQFDWRISIAEIENDCAFSSFPGYDRIISALDGGGMELTFNDEQSVILDQPRQLARFAGEWRTECRLLAGPTRDFNVMVKREVIHADILHRPLVDNMLFFTEPAVEWVVYLINGHIEFNAQGIKAESGDALHLLADDGGNKSDVMTGAGDLLLVKLTWNRPNNIAAAAQ